MPKNLGNKIGYSAAILSMAMYFSYIDQIKLALDGHKGSLLLAITTTINCATWVLYGFLKKKKDVPLIICNSVGFILGLITSIVTIIS